MRYTLLPLLLLLSAAPITAADTPNEALPTIAGPTPGGPPSVRIAGKGSGSITRSEWAGVRDVTLVGCVPGAHVVMVHLCIRNCDQREERLTTKGSAFLPTMKTAVANLPSGTSFTVEVDVVDGQRRTWEVAPARFTIVD